MEIPRIQIVERGAVPRAMAKYHRAAMVAGYRESAIQFDYRFRPLRFTVAHAVAADYPKPAGLRHPYGSKAFWASYYGRKLKKHGEALPWVKTGETRNRAKVPTLSVNAKRGQLKYKTNKLNYLPGAPAAFAKVLPSEAAALGQVFKGAYDREYNRDLNEGMRFV